MALEYLFLDGSHFRMHDGARAEPVLAAWGITTEGRLSPATIMGPPFRHEHGTTSSPFVPANADAAGLDRRRQAACVRGGGMGRRFRTPGGLPARLSRRSGITGLGRRDEADELFGQTVAEPQSTSTVMGVWFRACRFRCARTRQAGEQNRGGRPVPWRRTGSLQPGPVQTAVVF